MIYYLVGSDELIAVIKHFLVLALVDDFNVFLLILVPWIEALINIIDWFVWAAILDSLWQTRIGDETFLAF